MDDSYEELFRFLNYAGNIAGLRKYLIAFLLTLEGLREGMDSLEDPDSEEADRLIREIGSYLDQLSQSQKIADQMSLGMEKTQRQSLCLKATGVFKTVRLAR